MSNSSFLSLLDDVALNLRLNRTVCSKKDLIRKCVLLVILLYRYSPCIGLRIKEVFPSSGRVTGIQVDDNYITLPGEIFEDITESGTIIVWFLCNIFSFSIVFVASYYFENISNLLPDGAQE